MSGSLAAIITIPIVAFLALFTWLAAVLWASTHPRYRSQGSAPRTEVAGGAFQAVDGGRQLMPIPERRPSGVPAPRAAEESYAAPGYSSAAPGYSSAEAARVPGPRTPGEQPQVPAGQEALAGAGRGRGVERGASALTRRQAP
jgi:hypothetical protein